MSDERLFELLDERLSELEASSASHTEALANGNDGLNKFFENYKKESAELKEKLDSGGDGLVNTSEPLYDSKPPETKCNCAVCQSIEETKRILNEPREDDIHDYFMNHPDDLPRIKYQRLISEFLEDLLDDDNSRLELIGKWGTRKDLKWEEKLQ